MHSHFLWASLNTVTNMTKNILRLDKKKTETEKATKVFS